MAKRKKESAAAVTASASAASQVPVVPVSTEAAQQSVVSPVESKVKAGKKKKEKAVSATKVVKERKKAVSFKSRLKPDALDELIKAGKITEYKQLIKCGKKSCIDLAKKQNLLSDVEDINDFVKLGKKSFFSFFFKILLKK
jgi:hypothetical protein